MINRPEIRYTYFFSGLLVLQACALLYMAYYPIGISSYEWSFTEAASQTISSGHWGVPAALVSDQAPKYSPPLSSWLSAAGHSLLPDHWLGYRLFHIIFYLFAFCGFFLLVRMYLDARTAFYSCCVLASSLFFNWQMQMATPEGLAAIFMATALIGFYQYLKTNQQKFFWLIYVSLALGLITKGLVAIIIPLIILALYLMFRIKMNSENLKKVQLGKGLLFSFLIGLPWFLYAAWKEGYEWLLYFLSTIYWQTSYSPNPAVHEGAFYLPFLFIILTLLPFGFFLPKSFGYGWKLRQKKTLLLLSTLSLLVILIFSAFGDTFHPNFLLPAIPFTAIVIGFQLSQLQGRPLLKTKLYIGIAGIAVLALATPVGLYLLLQESVGEVTGKFYFILLLALLPLGTMISFGLWQFKRTDDGIAVLTVTYLLFNLLLLYVARTSEPLMEYVKMLIL